MSTPYENAKEWAEKTGMPVFPTNDSAPVTNQDVFWTELATTDPDVWGQEVWELASGFGARLDNHTVIDVDDLNAVPNLPEMENTFVVKTAKGYHAYYKGTVPGHTAKLKLIPGIDFLTGADHYTIGPGSLRRSGARYVIANDVEMASYPLQYAIHKWYDDNVRFKSSVKVKSGDTDDTVRLEVIPEGERNSRITSFAGALRRRGLHPDDIYAAVESYNKRVCKPPLSHKELKTIVNSVSKYDPDYYIDALAVLQQPLRDQIISMADLAVLESPGFIIDRIYPDAGVSILYGPSSSYKSFIAMSWAAAVADGLSLKRFTLDPEKHVFAEVEKRKVLYVIGEGAAGWSKRIRAANMEESELQILPRAIDLYDDKVWGEIQQILLEDEYGLVVFDTLQKMSPGADENNASDIGKLINKLDLLYNADSSKTGVATLIVHHSNKGESRSYRGSSAIEADCSNMWKVKRVSDNYAEIIAEKFKDAEQLTFYAHLEPVVAADSIRICGYSDEPDSEIDKDGHTKAARESNATNKSK